MKILFVDDELSYNIPRILRLFGKYLNRKTIDRLQHLDDVDSANWGAEPEDVKKAIEESNLIEVEYNFPDALRKIVNHPGKYALFITDRKLSNCDYTVAEIQEIEPTYSEVQYERFSEREGDYLLQKLVFSGIDVNTKFYFLTAYTAQGEEIRSSPEIATLINFGQFRNENFIHKGSEPDIARLQNLIDNLVILKQFEDRSGYANLEIELLNRQEDLINQDEIVLRFQIRNKGKIPANNVSVTLPKSKAYTLVSDSLYIDFIVPGGHTEADFKIRPLQNTFPFALHISYIDRINESIKKQPYEHYIQLSSETQKPFKLIKSPYRSGNLIQELEQGNTNMFFGRNDTIKRLKQILIDHDDNLVVIYGQRRTGKSCLMKYIQKAKVFEPTLFVIFADMQGLLSEKRFYEEILSQIEAITHSESENVTSFDEFKNSLSSQHIMLKTIDTRILIMIDEFECVTDTQFKYTSLSDAHEFLQRMRNLMQYTSNVKFAIAGADALKAMINDYNNPFFKAGRTLHIAFLHSQDARDLITKPLADKVIYTEQAITAIQEATFNHPYYIQCLCQILIDILNEKERYIVTLTEVNQAIEYLQRTETDIFTYVWKLTEPAEHLVLASIAQEINGQLWVSVDHIEHILTKNNVKIQGNILDHSIKKLVQKDFVIESNDGLEYTIPIGLLRTWIQQYKPLKRVRKEFSA